MSLPAFLCSRVSKNTTENIPKNLFRPEAKDVGGFCLRLKSCEALSLAVPKPVNNVPVVAKVAPRLIFIPLALAAAP